jgi:hypothetical protein
MRKVTVEIELDAHDEKAIREVRDAYRHFSESEAVIFLFYCGSRLVETRDRVTNHSATFLLSAIKTDGKEVRSS